LTFGANTTDRVECGHAASVADLIDLTVLMWVYPTTLTASRGLFTIGATASIPTVAIRLATASTDLDVRVQQATSQAQYVSNDNPLATNTWCFLAATYSQGATPRSRIYRGRLTSSAVESTYVTTTTGTGNKSSETGSGSNLTWGNRFTAGPAYAQAFQGRIAVGAYFNRVLTLGEILDWQFRPRKMTGCVAFYHLGFAGTGTQPDWSGNGNAGTVTGATVSDHAPIRAFKAVSPIPSYTVSAAAKALPPFHRSYRFMRSA
jgi:concanavalin A-like lectin/glucanase superfamily protein